MSFYVINLSLFQRSKFKDFDESIWKKYMKIALKNAQKASKIGEVPVGALLIDSSGKIIGSNINSTILMCDPTAHAEILVLREGAKKLKNYRLNGTVLITTLEPCIMCFGAIIQARIDGVVFGCVDPKGGVLVSKMDMVRDFSWTNHKFWVIYGIFASFCSELLVNFFRSKRNSWRGTEAWS